MNVRVSARIGSRLKRERKRLGWSLREAGKAAGVDFGQIGKTEKGQLGIHLDTLYRLSRAYGCTLSDLVSTVPGPRKSA
jgi:transcriptional regulator with XRE-family HTH domain